MKGNEQDKKGEGMNRREFIGGAAAAAAAFSIVPNSVLAGNGKTAPSDKLNIAAIGIGGKGKSDISGVSSENVIALCDVDDTMFSKFKEHVDRDKEKHPNLPTLFKNAKRFRDFREMLDSMPEIDAVTISTPDHTHATIAMKAMSLKKHVYCQKPLTHSVYEARMLAETAKNMDVVSQMGNQGHASEDARLINEWIWDGAIGDVTRVHVWTNRPVWPQGIDAPKEIPSVPPTLDWDLFLGPAPWRPYHPAYHPFAWRGWKDFGTGAVGDMGAHLIDHPWWALKLEAPETIQASSSDLWSDSFPLASTVHFTFPKRGKMAPVELTWYDGGLTPPRPKELEDGRRMGDGGGGVLFVGTEGTIMCGTYGSSPRIIPEAKMKKYKQPKKTIERSPGIYAEWIQAIKEGKKSTTDFSYSGPLTEAMMLGNIATLLQDDNKILQWDAKNMKFTNHDKANELVHTDYRKGWKLEY